MADLMVDFITSLDGYGAAEGWPGFWGLAGPEYLAWLDEQLKREHTTLMGANTYRLMAEMASANADDPGFAAMAQLPKVVFSRTLQAPLSWANTRLVAEDAVEAVREMKQSGTAPMRTLGSLALARSLLAERLVDRFRVVIFPVVNGRTGRDRIYDGWPEVTLELVNNRTFDGRLQLLEYVPSVLTGIAAGVRPAWPA